jgi:hypothetical protein
VLLPTSNYGSAIDFTSANATLRAAQTVLWPESRWKPIGLGDLLEPRQVLTLPPLRCVRTARLILVVCIVGEATVPQGHACGAPGPQREPHQRAQIHRQARVRGGQRGVQRVHHQGERVTSYSNYILILRRLRAVGCLQRDYKLGLLTRLLRGCKPQSW